MGYSNWDDDFYADRAASKAATGTPTFDYDAKVRSGAAPRRVHPRLDVRGKIRESRDSAAHPESTAIAVIFDVTGSMAHVPTVLQKKLPQLMGLLLRKGYIKDPQVLFGAVGDYHSDRVPLQIGQFESGVEMDDDVTSMVLEGGGGGSYEESYQNALYFLAHRTSIDCYEKRGKKGYAFLIGDEMPYPKVEVDELRALIAADVQAGATAEEIVAAAQEKYHLFFIIPKGTSHYGDPRLQERWKKLLGGQNVILLEEPAAVCETIGLTIGLLEGSVAADGIATDLADVGAGAAIVRAVAQGLAPLAKSTALVRTGTGSLPEPTGRSSGVGRL